MRVRVRVRVRVRARASGQLQPDRLEREAREGPQPELDAALPRGAHLGDIGEI